MNVRKTQLVSGGAGREASRSALELMVPATAITDFLDDRGKCRLGKPLSWHVMEPETRCALPGVPAHAERGCIRSKSNRGTLRPPGGIKHSAAENG